MTRSYPALLWISTAVCLLGSVQFGYQIAVLNTSLDFVADTLHFNSHSQGAIVVSIILIGASVGAILAGPLADHYGPKKALILNDLFPLLIGSIISASATTQSTLLTGRFITGIGVGACSLFVPRYITEIAPSPFRGLLGSFNQILINAGIVISFALGWPYKSGTPYYYTIHVFQIDYTIPWWRVMLCIGVIPAVLQAIGMVFCPETPVWLLWSGLHLEASKSYRALHGRSSSLLLSSSLNTADRQVEEQLLISDDQDQNSSNDDNSLHCTHQNNNNSNNNTLIESYSSDGRDTQGLSALFNKKYKNILILALSIPVLQQLSAINTVILYGTEVFKKAGIKSAIAANLIIGCINMIATLFAAALMDRAGRKILLQTSYIGMAVFLSVIGFLVPIAPKHLIGPLSFISIIGYIIFFAFGCGPVPWVYLPEILPSEIKGAAQSLATACNWLGNLVVGLSFPYMMSVMGLSGAYGVYAVLCALSAVFCMKYMVETKKRSLVQVHAELMIHDE